MAELNNQAVEVALAMLERDGCWLMQLRDDIPGIVAPGCWGLFGGHLDPGETAEQALQRELLEEISWQAELLHYAMEHRNPRRRAHVFCGQLTVPLAQLQLLEGQDRGDAEVFCGPSGPEPALSPERRPQGGAAA